MPYDGQPRFSTTLTDVTDFHRTGMYEEIVAEVARQAPEPDLVFFTGDLAFAGTSDDYRLLSDRFLTPLRKVLPDGCPIFTVPGNHDVDRNRVGKPRLWMADDEERAAFQRVDADGQRKRQDLLLPRFEAYRAVEKEFSAWGEDWLASEQGSACKIMDVRDRRVAVIGINTAWLCQDDDDWGKLTAGRAMVEAALRQAQAERPDLTVVLGHHPLSAMESETAWSDDGRRIHRLLERSNVVYLHGHLHTAGRQSIGDSLQSILAIQAPAGFDAPDDDKRRNGLMWGEVDFEGGWLLVRPLVWNGDDGEYKFDTHAGRNDDLVPEHTAFRFRLPGKPGVEAEVEPEPDPWPPAGWEVVDAASLARKTAERPSAKEMSDWFDGQFPRWDVALAEGVRPRRLVENLTRRFDSVHTGAPQPIAVLLTGAGGEGKSAALLQTAARLVQGEREWTCLWRSAAAAGLPEDMFERLEPRDGHAWIVAIDDAENIAQSLPAALKRIQPRTDVHLILAARDADWSIRGLTASMWHGAAAFRSEPLAGLDEEDARRIADGWVAYGDEAMGRLRGQTAEQAAYALLGHAQDQAARQEEGALLGALLIAREGDDLKGRVIRLMEPWVQAEGIGDRSLLDIYAMIAAMHAENQLYLSRAVLAFALGCGEDELDRGPLRILRREAMVDSGTTYILTRHRRIAETARDWLVESGYNVDRWYPFLARAALKEFKQRRSGNPDIGNWQFSLPEHFASRNRERWPVAVAVAKALFEVDPEDALLLTTYTVTLRHTEQARAALQLLRHEGPRFHRHRGVLYEWSVAAGEAGDYGLDVWLGGRSLADDRQVPYKPKDLKVCLAGLGRAFEMLFERTGQHSFAVAQAACGRLGLRLPDLDSTTRGYFERYAEAAPTLTGAPLTAEADVETLRTAVIEGSLETDPENDPPFFESLIGDPEGYRYSMLLAAIAGDRGGEETRSAHNGKTQTRNQRGAKTQR